MFNSTGEYAVRAAVFLAQHHGSPKTTSEIALATKVPQGYLSKIMQAMVRNGLIGSQRGIGGGFHLTREPQTITMLDVLAAVDVPLERITSCPLGLPSHHTLCPVHRLMDNGIAKMEAEFKSVSIFELIGVSGGSTPLCEATAASLDRRAKAKKG